MDEPVVEPYVCSVCGIPALGRNRFGVLHCHLCYDWKWDRIVRNLINFVK